MNEQVVPKPATLFHLMAGVVTAQRAAPAPEHGPFLPLDDADDAHVENGCACAFVVSRDMRTADLLQLSGRALLAQARADWASVAWARGVAELYTQACSCPWGYDRCAGSGAMVGCLDACAS